MSRSRVVVAIDGPAGAGKSTVAQGVADRLGFVRVDTGALYRGLALRAREEGIPWDDGARLGEFARTLKMEFAVTPEGPRLLIDGVDREDELRNPNVAGGASLVSGHPPVRAALLDLQRELGADGGVVLEGRDIGTVIFPDAEVKVFLTASAEARANRRLKDLQARGSEADYESLLSAIQERDARDSSREAAPLKPAEDAAHLDSTTMSYEEVVSAITKMAQFAMSPAS